MKNLLNKFYEELGKAGTRALYGHELLEVIQSDMIKYDDIHSIEELFENNNYIIVFVENKNSHIGHWVALIKYNKTIEYFCSYGYNPPDNKLYNLVKKSGYNLLINKFKFQKMPMTCGFHTLFRIFCFKYHNMNLNKYIKFMKDLEDYDRAVICFVVYIVNNK